MNLARLVLPAVLLLLGCGGGQQNPPPASSPAAPFRVVDLMPRYWAFREATAKATPAERVRRFRADVIAAEPRFFEQVIGPADDDRIGSYLETAAGFDSITRRIAADFLETLPRSWARLQGLFPDLTPGVRIFVTPSLFNSNGQVRYLDDSAVVMLGPDVQAYVEVVIDSGKRIPAGLTIEHELAHYHHWSRNPELATAAKSFFRPGAYSALYYNLWSEGFATYVARRLNPDVPLATILGPGLDPARDDGKVPSLAREFLDKLDSTAEDDIRDLFYLSGRRKDIPARSAYYIGLQVVERLAAKRSLAELVTLGGPALREAIAGELAAIRDEPRAAR